jgi:hypothetical protein
MFLGILLLRKGRLEEWGLGILMRVMRSLRWYEMYDLRSYGVDDW